MNSKRKSAALKKFQSHHPDQHQLFSTVFQSAKQCRTSKFLWQSESDQINCEWSNMIRNEELFRFREEDNNCEERKIAKRPLKTVSWSTNLLDIRTISPREHEGCWPPDIAHSCMAENPGIKTKKIEKVTSHRNIEQNAPELIEYQATCYEHFTMNDSKLLTRRESYKSFLRIRYNFRKLKL